MSSATFTHLARQLHTSRGSYTSRAAVTHLARQLHTPRGSYTPRAADTHLARQLRISSDSHTSRAAGTHLARQLRISSGSHTSRAAGTHLARQLHTSRGRYGYQPMDIDKKEQESPTQARRKPDFHLRPFVTDGIVMVLYRRGLSAEYSFKCMPSVRVRGGGGISGPLLTHLESRKAVVLGKSNIHRLQGGGNLFFSL